MHFRLEIQIDLMEFFCKEEEDVSCMGHCAGFFWRLVLIFSAYFIYWHWQETLWVQDDHAGFLWFSLQALRAAVQNYPDMASSFWDIIFRVVAGAIDVSIESSIGVCLNKLDTPLGFVMSVSAPGSGQSSRLSDDKLVHSAVKVWNSLLRCK